MIRLWNSVTLVLLLDPIAYVVCIEDVSCLLFRSSPFGKELRVASDQHQGGAEYWHNLADETPAVDGALTEACKRLWDRGLS